MKKTVLLLFGLVATAASANSPYISKVHDFCPAPGQFVNVIPQGASKADVLADCEANIAGAALGEPRPGMISLGAYGGYVVFSFDHPVVNAPGDYDFKIYGNSFVQTGTPGIGSSEAGIVMVSVDANHNGLPDDPWYELVGSEHANPLTQRAFEITYYRTPADHVAVTDRDHRYASDLQYIRWTSNDPANPEGYLEKNIYHNQDYWPAWIDAETLTFAGTRLRPTVSDTEGVYTQAFFDYGYADNRPNDEDPGLKIDWAVDADGNPVELKYINFIKVYTAQNQKSGPLGETSTEITGGEDLHPKLVPAGISEIVADDLSEEIYTLSGLRVRNTENLPAGVYIRRAPEGFRKIIIR